MCKEEARHEAERNRSEELAFYVVIGFAATGANRKAGNYRGRTAREIFVVSWFRIFSDLALSPRVSLINPQLVLSVEANEAFEFCVVDACIRSGSQRENPHA